MDRQELLRIILAKISKGEYDALDEIVLQFPDDIRVVYYSCLLYEQMDSDDGTLAEHISFWEKELECDHAFETLLRKADELGFCGWPTEISVEASSYCNAKCRNCTHEELIRSGRRVQKLADKQVVFYRIRKTKLITLLFHSEVAAASPVGLGEPLTHPDIVEIIAYMKAFFPVVGINTNAGLLSGQYAKRLTEVGLDYIYLSLSYFDKQVYEKEIGLNYDTVIDNICNFLEIRKKAKSSGTVVIHIFDNNLNSEEDIKQFKDKFRPLLQKDDNLQIRQYVEWTETEAKTRITKRDEIRPCYELWMELIVDVDGNVFPCCMGVWKEFDPYLTVGNIKDSVETIVGHLIDLRRKQLEGDMGSCMACSTLQHNIAFRLPPFCYDKDASAHGEIQYREECTLSASQLFEIEKRVARYDWRYGVDTEYIVGDE